MQAADVMQNLLTMVNTPLPESERQVRPLVGLKPADAKEAWRIAADKRSSGEITGSFVANVVREVIKREREPRFVESWQKLVRPY